MAEFNAAEFLVGLFAPATSEAPVPINSRDDDQIGARPDLQMQAQVSDDLLYVLAPAGSEPVGQLLDLDSESLDQDETHFDVANLIPCPSCGSLEAWWPAVGEPRCQSCDTPVAAWRTESHQLQTRSRRSHALFVACFGAASRLIARCSDAMQEDEKSGGEAPIAAPV